MLAGFDAMQGFVQGATGCVFSLTPGISSSLARVTLAKTNGTNVDVLTAKLAGKIPTGRVEAMAYAAGIDRFVLIVRAMRPHRIEIVTIALTDSDATAETLAQPAPLAADGAMFTALYPKGGGDLLAVRGNDLYTLTVGAQATWSAPVSASNFYRGNSANVVLDAPHGRLVGYGRDVFDVQTQKVKFEPSVGTMPLSGPYSWTELSLAGAPPTNGQSFAPSWAALDAGGQRLLAVVSMDDTCPGNVPCSRPTLWEAKLAQGTWTELRDFFTPPTMYRPFATDDAAHRVLSWGDGALGAMGIDAQSNLQAPALVQKGDLGPSFPSAAVLLSNGKLLSSDGGIFRVLDPSAAAPRWERFGTTTLSQAVRYRPTFTEDPRTGEVLVYGGASSDANDGSGDTFVLAKDGSKLDKLTLGSGSPAPAGRTSHGAAMLGGALVVAGGASNVLSASLDDVWALDRATSTWKKVATMPQPLTSVTMRVAAGSTTAVWALGYAKTGNDYALARIVEIDVATGKSRSLSSLGEAPKTLWSVAPYGTCFVGFESGDTVDGSEPQLWRCKREGDGVRWEKTPIDANDESLGGAVELRGAGAADGSRAFFVGRTLFAAAPKR
jgi:hypothetical protein